MIQFKRGKTSTWKTQSTPLADGQPGYDKDRNKIKIGNGKDTWDNLPDASGLRMEEILVSEKDAQDQKSGLLSPLALFKKIFLRSGKPIFTYGTEAPSEETLGQVYLQHYDDEPETDHIVSFGSENGWAFKKWKSGTATCSGVFELTTTLSTDIETGSLYHNDIAFSTQKYPFTFIKTPCETASLQTAGGVAWLASVEPNSETSSGVYKIISTDSKSNLATYKIAIQVEGRWKA